MRGAIALRKGKSMLLGLVAILAGLFILLALVLPKEFWWFALGVGLIGLGLWYIRCCC